MNNSSKIEMVEAQSRCVKGDIIVIWPRERERERERREMIIIRLIY